MNSFNALLRQFTRFLLAGVVATAIQYMVLWLAVVSDTLIPVVASALGYLLGAVANYLLNYFVTFKNVNNHKRSTKRYAVMVLIGWCLTILLMFVLQQEGGLYYWFAQLITSALVLCGNFLVSRWWVFKVAT